MNSRLRIMMFCIALSACAQPFPAAEECKDNNDCYIQHTVNTLKVISSQIDYWDNITLVAALIAGLSGIVATIMIALQGDDNRVWTRPIGIVATALVTGITALVTSFHIPESKDKYIMAYSLMIQLNNKIRARY